MLYGDISNQRDYIIGIRVEDCLFKFKEEGLKNRILNFINGKVYNADINENVLSLMRYIYERTSYTISLIIDEDNFDSNFEFMLEKLNVPYNQIGNVVNGSSSITRMLMTGELTYYVDTNERRLQEINSEYAVTLEEFNTILVRRVYR